MDTRETVFLYSEWLDGDQQLLEAPDGDERTHEDLVNEFFDEYAEVFDAA